MVLAALSKEAEVAQPGEVEVAQPEEAEVAQPEEVEVALPEVEADQTFPSPRTSLQSSTPSALDATAETHPRAV